MSDWRLNRRALLKATGYGTFVTSGLSAQTVSGRSSKASKRISREGVELTFVPADPEAGFHYPYYLYAPETSGESEKPILVEPNNTGTSTDDFETHRESAERLITHGMPRRVGDELEVPVLVPVFPRPKSDPVDYQHYVHALDFETMHIETGRLARVDLQLLRMVDHAIEQLTDRSYPVAEDILMNGFSASGNFVNRFTALHPERVRSVTAGGINGTAILPHSTAKGHTVNYPIGVADIDTVTGSAFDLEQWTETGQLVYMGGDDENDTIPYNDAWNQRQRRVALDVYGEHMQQDRMPYCKSVYEDVDTSGRVSVYPNVGHRPITEVIVDFHRRYVEPQYVAFSEPPVIDASSVRVRASIQEGESPLEVRVFSSARGDVTGSPLAISSGEEINTHVSLTDSLGGDEQLTVTLMEPSETDPSRAIVSDDAMVLGRVQFVERPTAGAADVAVEYALSSEYRVKEGAMVRLETEQGGTVVLQEITPGATDTVSVPVDEEEHGIPFEQGRELRAVIVDDDPVGLNPVASDTVVVDVPDDAAISIGLEADSVVARGNSATAEAHVRAVGGDAEDLTDVPISFVVHGETVGTDTVSLEVGETESVRTTFDTTGYDDRKLTITATGKNATTQETTILATEPAAGDGSIENPFEVSNASELAYASLAPDSHFILVTDIDLAEFEDYVRIGNQRTAFSGSLDGQSYEIRNLKMEKSLDQYDGIGLFGNLAEASVKNLHLADVNITGDDFVGGVVGMAATEGEIARVSVTGDITGKDNVGGIIGGTTTGGSARRDVVISEAISNATIQGDGVVGGILGQSSGDIVEQSMVTGTIRGSGAGGGIVGLNALGGIVRESYSSAAIDGRGGGLVGNNSDGSVIDSYWDSEAAGMETSDGEGVGLTTAEMTGDAASTNLDGFDFATTWTTTNGYPQLAWRSPIEVTEIDGPEMLEPDEPATVSITLTNSGGTTVEEPVEFWFGEERLKTRTLSLEANETTTETFTLETSGRSVREYDYRFVVDTKAYTRTVQVITEEGPAFRISNLEFPETVPAGTTPSASVTITNLGQGDEQEIAATITDTDGNTEVETVLGTPSLASGDEIVLEEELRTRELPIGDYVLTVATDNETYETEFSVARTTYIEFATQPQAGETEVSVNVSVGAGYDEALRVRVGDETERELTKSPGTPRPGTVHEDWALPLKRGLEENEAVTVVVQPSGSYSGQDPIDAETVTVGREETEPTEDNTDSSVDTEESNDSTETDDGDESEETTNEKSDPDQKGTGDTDQEVSTDADGTGDDGTPGFTVVGSLSTLGGTSYLLKRRFTSDEDVTSSSN